MEGGLTAFQSFSALKRAVEFLINDLISVFLRPPLQHKVAEKNTN